MHRKMMHNRQIMGNEKIGKPHFLLQPFHKVQDLRLHGHIQSRGGFVTHHELGARRKGARNCDPLSLTA
jgi:hypothetical protein